MSVQDFAERLRKHGDKMWAPADDVTARLRFSHHHLHARMASPPILFWTMAPCIAILSRLSTPEDPLSCTLQTGRSRIHLSSPPLPRRHARRAPMRSKIDKKDSCVRAVCISVHKMSVNRYVHVTYAHKLYYFSKAPSVNYSLKERATSS